MVEVNIVDAKARALIVEEVLGEAKNQVLAMKEEAQAKEVWASKVVAKAFKAFKVGEEYCQGVLVSCRDTFL